MLYPIETTTIKPRNSVILILLLIAVGFLIYVRFQQPTSKDLDIILLGMVLLTILIKFAFNKVEMIVSSEGLTYKTIFRTREIIWAEVTETYIKYQHHGKSGNHYWFFTTTSGNLKFSLSLYSRKNLRFIAEAVVSRCNQAQIQERIIQMAEGKFPWYIF